MHTDLRSASVTVTDWHVCVCEGDIGCGSGFWADAGVVVTPEGLRRIGDIDAAGPFENCGDRCPVARTAPAVGGFFRFRHDLIAVTLDLKPSPDRPSGCPIWSGTYVLQKDEGRWLIQMFASRN